MLLTSLTAYSEQNIHIIIIPTLSIQHQLLSVVKARTLSTRIDN